VFDFCFAVGSAPKCALPLIPTERDSFVPVDREQCKDAVQVHFLISVFAPGVKRGGRRAGSDSHFFAALVGLPSAALVVTGDEVETVSSLALICKDRAFRMLAIA
jgi:hypothetical protein